MDGQSSQKVPWIAARHTKPESAAPLDQASPSTTTPFPFPPHTASSSSSSALLSNTLPVDGEQAASNAVLAAQAARSRNYSAQQADYHGRFVPIPQQQSFGARPLTISSPSPASVTTRPTPSRRPARPYTASALLPTVERPSHQAQDSPSLDNMMALPISPPSSSTMRGHLPDAYTGFHGRWQTVGPAGYPMVEQQQHQQHAHHQEQLLMPPMHGADRASMYASNSAVAMGLAPDAAHKGDFRANPAGLGQNLYHSDHMRMSNDAGLYAASSSALGPPNLHLDTLSSSAPPRNWPWTEGGLVASPHEQQASPILAQPHAPAVSQPHFSSHDQTHLTPELAGFTFSSNSGSRRANSGIVSPSAASDARAQHARIRSISAASAPSHQLAWNELSGFAVPSSPATLSPSPDSSARQPPGRKRASSSVKPTKRPSPVISSLGSPATFSGEEAAVSPSVRTIGGSGAGTTRRTKFKRSRTGCKVCRIRKIRCSEDGQPCKQCRIGDRQCFYEPTPTPRRRSTKDKVAAASGPVSPGLPRASPEKSAEEEDDDGSFSNPEDHSRSQSAESPGSIAFDMSTGLSFSNMSSPMKPPHVSWNARPPMPDLIPPFSANSTSVPPAGEQHPWLHPVASGIPSDIYQEPADFDNQHLLPSLSANEDVYPDQFVGGGTSHLFDPHQSRDYHS